MTGRRIGVAGALLALLGLGWLVRPAADEPAPGVPVRAGSAPRAPQAAPAGPDAADPATASSAPAEGTGEAALVGLLEGLSGARRPPREEVSAERLLEEVEDPSDLALALRRRLDRHPDEAPGLARRLAHLPDPTVRFVAARSLAPHSERDGVRDVLLAMLDYGTIEEQEVAPFGFLGSGDPDVLERLIEVYAAPVRAPAVRAAAAYVLAGSIEAAGSAARERACAVAASLAADRTAPRDLRRESLEVLACSGVPESERARLLEAARVEPDEALRLALVRALHPAREGAEPPPEVRRALERADEVR